MIKLEPNKIYHIYNRANGNEALFLKNDNYLYFLKKYEKYILPIADTFAYCLMPNHFHFLIEIKDEQHLYLQGFQNLEGTISQQFSNLFNAYTKAFNKQNGRMGSLFIPRFKRKEVDDDNYLRKLVHYIHFNPVKAELCKKPEEWKFSSYPALISDKTTMLNREKVISLFDDLDNFIYCHKEKPMLTGIDWR